MNLSLQYIFYKTSKMQPENKSESKMAIRDKNRTSAKEFIKLKRGKLKEEKSNFEVFEVIRNYIVEGNSKLFQESIRSNQPEAILTFLFSENELKQTPFMQIIRSEACCSLLKSLHFWSAEHTNLVEKEVNVVKNEFKSKEFGGKFQNLNKLILEVFNSRITEGKSISEEIVLLGEKDGLFYHLAKQFLTLQLIISSLTSLKTKNNLLTRFYCELLSKSDLRELQVLREQVKGYQSILLRESLWSKVDASIFAEINEQTFELLTLKELNYNIWHELANRNSTEFIRCCEILIERSVESKQQSQSPLALLLEIDSSGEIPLDKCLRLWKYEAIKHLFELNSKIEEIVLSTSSLNKLFHNRNLNQIQRQTLISQCLSGQISMKGYIKVIPKLLQKQLLITQQPMKKIIVERKPTKYIYNICYDKLELKKSKDNTGAYPLITYLKIYRGNANLKIIQQLFLESFSSKYIKKQLNLLLKSLQQNMIRMDNNSPKWQQIMNIFDYYQPLWKIATLLPHGDILEYLLSKLYTNCNQMKLLKSSSFTEIYPLGNHFIALYIQNNPFLGSDSINKQLVEGIIHCKENERTIGKYDQIRELIKSLNPIQLFHTSQDYLVVTLRQYLKEHLSKYIFDEFFYSREIWGNKMLLEVITDPLNNKKPSLLKPKQVVQKFSSILYSKQEQEIDQKQHVFRYFYDKLPKELQSVKLPVERGNPFQYISKEEKFGVQEMYFREFKPEDLNEAFFDGLQNYLSSKTENVSVKKSLQKKFFSFRFRPQEQHLTYKFIRLLEYGMDPYFSKYSKGIQFKEKGAIWNLLMRRMVDEHCTFLCALFTEPTAKLDDFKEIFQVSMKKEYSWLSDTKIYDSFESFHAQRYRQAINLEQYRRKCYNFEFIVDFLELYEQHGLEKDQKYMILKNYFKFNIKELSREIDELQSQRKYEFQLKKSQLQDFINRWMPYLLQDQKANKEEIEDSAEEDFVEDSIAEQSRKKQYLVLLIEDAQNTRREYLVKALIKFIKIRKLPRRYRITKLKYTPNAGEVFYLQLLKLTYIQLINWIKLMRGSRNKLLEVARTFPFQFQKLILTDLLKRQIHPTQNPYFQLTINTIAILVKTILKSVSFENLPDLLKLIESDPVIQTKIKEKYKKSLLRSAENVELVTIGLIILNQDSEGFFYLKGDKIKRYSSLNFYSQCNEENFSIYVKNLKKYFSHSINLPVHLKKVVNSLIESQLWERLGLIFSIKELQEHTSRLILLGLFLTTNKKLKLSHSKLKAIIKQLFSFYEKKQVEFDEDQFVAAFFIDNARAFSIFKPVKLSNYAFKKCITAFPQSSPLFITKGITLNKDYIPAELQETHRLFPINKKLWFSFCSHNASRLEADKWLIDEIRIEAFLLKQFHSHQCILNTLNAICANEVALKHKTQLFEGHISDKRIIKMILQNNQVESLQRYEKFFPEMMKLVQEELMDSKNIKKGRCMNLNSLHKTLLRELIAKKYISATDKKDLYSCFLRVVDTANLDIIELFTTTNQITINQSFLKGVEESFGYQFWDHLLAITNQTFLIAFITKYKMFQIFNPQEYSQKLLNTICNLRMNKLFEFTIKYFEAKLTKKIVFCAQTLQNKPMISKSGVFYLPIQASIDNSFYEAFFLIQGSQNQCRRFKISGRFLSSVNPEEWNYIPELKRRVEINNTLMESIREAQEMSFRFQVLLPSIFDLQKQIVVPKQQQIPPKKGKKTNIGYSESLCQFIYNLTRKSLNLTEMSGTFEKLCFMLFKSQQTKIPDFQLQKKYPSEMKVIGKIKKFIEGQFANVSLMQLFQFVPEFKSLLLIYNPNEFLKNPEYMNEIVGQGKKKLDFSQYLKGIQINFVEFQTKYYNILEKYISNYFFESSISLGDPKASHHLTREALLLIFLQVSHYERRWNECLIFNLCRKQMISQYENPQGVLHDLSMFLNIRANGQMTFDLMVWNKIIKELNEIEQEWKRLGKGLMKEYKLSSEEKKNMIDNYSSITAKKMEKYTIINLNDILSEVYEEHISKCNKKGALLELSLILNSLLLQNDIKILDERIKQIKGGSNIHKYNIKLVKEIKQELSFDSGSQLHIEVIYSIQKHESKQISLLFIDYQKTIEMLQHILYLSDLQQNSEVFQLNNFCEMGERQLFLKNYKFRYTCQSFKKVKYQSLLNILEHGHMKNDGVVGKMLYEMEKIEEKLVGTKNIKVYSASDIYGPINFSEEKDDEKIIDCLGFYELIELPKDEQVRITYSTGIFDARVKNQLALKQLKNYLKYYIVVSKDQIPAEKLQMDSEVFVSISRRKDEEKVELHWWRFGGWTICEIYCLVLNYCSDLSSKIEKILDARVSFLSLINYYEKYLQVGGTQSMKIAFEKLLFQKQFNMLIECIIIMITEDVGNIMKIVKGIIIKWQINKKNAKKRANVVISECTSAISVDYIVKDHLLSIVINLQMQKDLNKSLQGDDCNLLVDRKQFLDSVFTSAQFLTDYFLMKNELNNACLNISTSITGKLNTTVNFHIEYSNLYKFIEKMRKEKSIKDIESYLIRLKQYLLNSMDKTINVYLNSQEIANKHQVFLLNKCESINKNEPYEKIQTEKDLIYDSLETEPQNGLYETITLMNEIGNEEAIKSTFLIQIYKSYYTTMVGEGMTFVVGYKSNKKKAQVIKITKAENINLINIVELDYIMLVSKNIPTNDELNQSKIIRIFITDSNKNLYRMNDKIKKYFLSLSEENDERNVADFAPLIASDIKLNFQLNEQREKDTKSTKIFYIDLNESAKLKLFPLADKPLTPLNSCKKSLEFKEAIIQLQKGFKHFSNHSMKIIIDLPQEFSEKYVNTNFSHIIHLVSSDIQQFLLKFEFQPMRNETLDCKLSIQKNLDLNKNSIIYLRKQNLINYFNRFRIRIRDNQSGITFRQNQISVNIDTSNMTTLPSSSQYLSVVIDNILSKEKKTLPKYVTFAETIKNESTEILLKELDLINCIPYQVQQIQSAIALIELIFKKKIENFRIFIERKKSEIKFDNEIELHLNVETVQREFYSAEKILQAFVASKNKGFQPNVKAQTYFNPMTKTIIVEECPVEQFKLIYQDSLKNWKSVGVLGKKQNSKIQINFTEQCIISSRYYLIESENIYSNYFFSVDETMAITQKNSQGIRCKQKYLYLQSQKPINLNFTNISITQTHPLFRQNTNTFNIIHNTSQKNKIHVRLLSKNIYFLNFNYDDSMILSINYATNQNIFNSEIDNTKLVISSDGALCLDNTKFIELQSYKKKPVLIKEKENQGNNHEFRESHEVATEMEFQIKLGDANNIENLVYVVNDQCKKYLTRAGEQRVDYIQLCDTDGNPIDYKYKLEVLFVHINKIAIIRPEIFNRNLQFGLRWTPVVRGHYYLYINNVRMSPPYEIGVCAGQADYKTTIITLPKITKICYCQETELMLDLRDSFKNLYTQLEEDIIGDSLLIELRCSKMTESLKIEKSQINKYGLKKVKFSFNNAEAEMASQIDIQIHLNCEFVSTFSVMLEGLSLKQRKKLLDKDISLSSKNYYKDITINRNKFLEELFVIAEKSLHTNLSVKFYNEPGIDAGGVKREFYDMVGNEIKSESNPFFKLINPNTMEYFLNPEILRNKKKLEYMQLWGKYLANSFLNSYLIGVSFSPVFVKLLYEQSIDYQDLLSVLPIEQRKQYEYLLTASVEEFQDLDLYFTAMIDKKKCVEIELKEGGKQIQVTAENVKEYLECTAQALITERYKEIMIAFKKGFETVLEIGLFKKWIRNSEFWCLTAGNKEITPQLVLNYVVFQGGNIDNISGWFRRFITEANHEILVGFLKFSSGSSSIDFSLTSKVTVTFENAGENPKKLPISHTCWKEIVVPKYKNYDIMKKLLTAAFIYCSQGFGFG